MPILPEHVYGKFDYKKIADEKFDPPLVGTGPYTLVEWKTGQFARFVRNPNYWGKQGFADEVVLQFFPDATDTMVQALKSGELDYAHDVEPGPVQAAPDRPGVHRGRGRGERLDAARVQHLRHRDRQDDQGRRPVDEGAARPGVPRRARATPSTRRRSSTACSAASATSARPSSRRSSPTGTSSPTTPRTFDIELAKQKLDAAGYALDADGKRLDKEGKPIVLRLVYPNTNDNYAKSAQFVQEWYGAARHRRHRSRASTATRSATWSCRPRRTRPARRTTTSSCGAGRAARTRTRLLSIFRCDQIGIASDSQYCNPEYDALYDKQSTQAGEERQATLAEMQNLIYDEAPYDILFYDSNLDVYRNDRFAGWQNMPGERHAVLHLRHRSTTPC